MRASLRHATVCAVAGALALTGCTDDADPAAPDDTSTTTTQDPGGENAAPETTAPGTTAPDTAAPETAPETATPERPLPDPPGELIDVDGRQVHLYCTGAGDTTVLLEAGLGDPSLTFWRLQDELSASTRVCSYDRAGLGWSEPGPEPRTGEQMVEELEALLRAADEPGPYLLAGHSLGGLVMLLFADRNPANVTGVVLIDSSHPDQEAAFDGQFPQLEATEEDQLVSLQAIATRAEAGELEPGGMVALTPLGLPLDVRELMAELLVHPTGWRTLLAEYDATPQTLDQAGDVGSLGDLPLVVIAAGVGLEGNMSAYNRQQLGITPEDVDRHDAIWRDLQEDHVTRSTDSRLVVAEDSSHYVHLDEREVVAEAIRSLLPSP